jgi:hypothetical protein
VPLPFEVSGTRPLTFELWVWLVAGGVNGDFRHAIQTGDASGATRNSIGHHAPEDHRNLEDLTGDTGFANARAQRVDLGCGEQAHLTKVKDFSHAGNGGSSGKSSVLYQ